jgi:iron complex transport system substrate-binding protein
MMRAWLVVPALGGLLAAALPVQGAEAERTCLDRFDPARDYFPDKSVVEAAEGFTVEYRKSYKLVTVKQAYSGGPPERYVLVRCGAPVPALTGELASAVVVRVPVRAMFSVSTTHLPPLASLGRIDVVTGVATLDHVTTPEALARIQAGKVLAFGARTTLDIERVVAGRPDVLMTAGDQNVAYATLRTAGIPVVANVEWLEPTPLGRAEWVKYIALFVDEEAKAASLFEGVRRRYAELQARARTVPETDRPRVMTGKFVNGQFHIAGGRSYVARLIEDAGGRYVWAGHDDATGTPLVDLESQLRRAADADVWINGGGWKDQAAMLAEEPRYAEFKAYRTGQVWVYERKVSAAGAYDYWTRSVTRPDLVLADLVKVFHPRLAADHAFEWYLQVPRGGS